MFATTTATVLAITAIALSVTAAGVGAYASYASAKAQEEASDYNAAVARNNAQAAEDQAAYEANLIRKRNLRMRGRQRAVIAKSGITVEGSPDDVMYDSAIEGEKDALAALYTGKIESTNQRAAAKLSKMEGKAAMQAGYFNMGSSILSGASSATGAYSSAYYSQPRFR